LPQAIAQAQRRETGALGVILVGPATARLLSPAVARAVLQQLRGSPDLRPRARPHTLRIYRRETVALPCQDLKNFVRQCHRGHPRDPVKISFFGGIDFGRVGDPVAVGGRLVASLLDVFGTKLATITQRIESRDYILQWKSALEGERKQVTVLFADVKGSMELAEQLDPEEVAHISAIVHSSANVRLLPYCSVTTTFAELHFVEENCSDGRGNDGDGLTDCADPKCEGAPGCLTSPTPRAPSGCQDFHIRCGVCEVRRIAGHDAYDGLAACKRRMQRIVDASAHDAAATGFPDGGLVI
jgi:hypothetical protein